MSTSYCYKALSVHISTLIIHYFASTTRSRIIFLAAFFFVLAVDKPNFKSDSELRVFNVPQILAERRRVISQQGVDEAKELHDPLVLP